jgi:hypothetical protein
MEIGLPTNVKHVSHMGYTEEGGFQFDEQPMPLEWKKLFRAAGVKRKDLENKETAKLIVDTITANMTPEELARLPPLPGVTERVEAAQARRDVQARRAEQAKLMMAMLENGGDAAKGMEVMMMQGGETKPPPPPSSSTLPPGAPPPPPGALKPQTPKTDAGGRTLKPVGAAAAAEAKETDKAARAKQLRKAADAAAAAAAAAVKAAEAAEKEAQAAEKEAAEERGESYKPPSNQAVEVASGLAPALQLRRPRVHRLSTCSAALSPSTSAPAPVVQAAVEAARQRASTTLAAAGLSLPPTSSSLPPGAPAPPVAVAGRKV